MATEEEEVIQIDSGENADWIKTVVGKDGLTAREREELAYLQLKKEFESE